MFSKEAALRAFNFATGSGESGAEELGLLEDPDTVRRASLLAGRLGFAGVHTCESWFSPYRV